MNNTKIVATIGPSSSNLDVLRELFNSGMDVARINMSYASHEFCLDIIKKINKLNSEYSKKIAIMLDIAGPEVRINEIEDGKAYLSEGDKIRVYSDNIIGDKTKFSVNYTDLINDVKINDVLKINNGKITLKTVDKGTNYILCEVIIPGEIETGNSINVPGRRLNIPFLSEKDLNDIKFACENKIDFLALSFVSNSEDVLKVNDILIELNNDHIGFFSKIENENAINDLDQIIKVSDGVVVARGDLGVNIPIERVPLLQKEIINKCHEYGKISIVSTEFLSSMENDLIPTRAEVSDVANAVIDGADVVLLSSETTNGRYPIETVKIMEKIIGATEDGMKNKNIIDDNFDAEQDITGSVAYSVVECAKKIGCKAIIAPTMSGYTAIKLSKFRPNSPIIALSPNIDTVKSLTLHYGVHPIAIKPIKTFDEIISIAKECTKSVMNISENDKIIITGGYPFSKVKHTNFMKIEEL